MRARSGRPGKTPHARAPIPKPRTSGSGIGWASGALAQHHAMPQGGSPSGASTGLHGRRPANLNLPHKVPCSRNQGQRYRRTVFPAANCMEVQEKRRQRRYRRKARMLRQAKAHCGVPGMGMGLPAGSLQPVQCELRRTKKPGGPQLYSWTPALEICTSAGTGSGPAAGSGFKVCGARQRSMKATCCAQETVHRGAQGLRV